MKNKKDPLTLFLLAILEVGTVVCAVPAFVSVNFPNSKAANFKNSIFISICFLIISLVFYFTATKRKWWGFLGLIFNLMVELLTLVLIFPNQSGRSWASNFFKELGREIQNLSHFNFVIMPEILATILFFTLITIFLLVSIYYYQWYVTFPIVLTYLLSVTVFDNHEHLVESILVLLFFAIQLFFVSNYEEIFIQKIHLTNLFTFGLMALILAIAGGVFFRNTFIHLAQVIDSPGVKVRNRLNTLGFYQSVNDQSQNKPDAKNAGFSINSQELGGPILDNEKLVYTVWEKAPNYLRIDTKNNYSGRGFNDHETLGSDILNNSVLKDDLHLPLLKPNSTVKIIYPSNTKHSGSQFIPQVYGKMEIDLKSQKIKMATNNDLNSILQFNNDNDTKDQIVYNVNYYDLSLNNLKNSDYLNIPAKIIKSDTQLPRKVPTRNTLYGKAT